MGHVLCVCFVSLCMCLFFYALLGLQLASIPTPFISCVIYVYVLSIICALDYLTVSVTTLCSSGACMHTLENMKT